MQLGLPEFYRRHQLGEPSAKDTTVRTYPRVFSPGTNHYSWPKASTVLGIGDSNIIHIQVDSKARQDIESKLFKICETKCELTLGFELILACVERHSL